MGGDGMDDDLDDSDDEGMNLEISPSFKYYTSVHMYI